jgi:hypothetical protein
MDAHKMKKFIKNLENTITGQEDLEKFAASKLSVVSSVLIELKSKHYHLRWTVRGIGPR